MLSPVSSGTNSGDTILNSNSYILPQSTNVAVITMKLKEIYRSPNFYAICECDRVNGLVIDVICGGIAMYSRIIELSEDGMIEYKNKRNLDTLAYKISKEDKSILERELKPKFKDEKIEYLKRL